MQAPGQATGSRDTALAEDYREEARAAIAPGETQGMVGGGGLHLVRIVLTDGGPVEREDGTVLDRPDVICTLRPEEARRRAIELLQAAERAESESTRGRPRRSMEAPGGR
jgi:hypothetical protein